MLARTVRMYCASDLSPRNGSAGAITGYPAAWSRATSTANPVASAKAPCTSTMVGLAVVEAVRLAVDGAEDEAEAGTPPEAAVARATATSAADAVRRDRRSRPRSDMLVPFARVGCALHAREPS